jgi:hypothetical protein
VGLRVWYRYHFGVTYNATATTLTLYLDGERVHANTNWTFQLSDVGNITQPWIGFSQWLNTPMDARLMDFHFYTGTLK